MIASMEMHHFHFTRHIIYWLMVFVLCHIHPIHSIFTHQQIIIVTIVDTKVGRYTEYPSVDINRYVDMLGLDKGETMTRGWRLSAVRSQAPVTAAARHLSQRHIVCVSISRVYVSTI